MKTESLWLATSAPKTWPQLRSKVSVDVAVVGAGITGLTAAILLKQAGLKVAVVEAHQVAGGESGHTTAHLTEVLDTSHHQLIRKFGLKKARLVAQSHRSAIDKISQLVHGLHISCGFRRVPGWLYSEYASPGSTHANRDLRQELRASRRLGMSVTWQDSIPLGLRNTPIAGALRFGNQAMFHPVRYLRGLAQAIAGDGSHIFENSPMTGIGDGEPCRLVVGGGPGGMIEAREVIVASHCPISNRIVLHTKVAAYRTYVLAVKTPPPGENPLSLGDGGLYWDTDEPYHYIREQTIDGERFWLIGGEDHKTGVVSDTGEHFQNLERYARQRFDVRAVTHRWSGQILQSVDGLPWIGKNPGSDHLYTATGYSGNGMTFGTVAGMLLSDQILHRENAWAAVYNPSRLKPRAAFRRFVAENMDFPLCFVGDRLTPAEASSLRELHPGQGKILALRSESTGSHGRAAVYRDENGAIHAVSPVCTHLGCHVRFNSAEKSWDCPCHGSRYGVDGQVINGPATRALTKIELEDEEAEVIPGTAA